MLLSCIAAALLSGCEPGEAAGTEPDPMAETESIPTEEPTDRGESLPAPAVEVVWTANAPASRLQITVDDPDGRAGWRLGLAETNPSQRGWFGEDCFLGVGASLVCHPLPTDGRLTLHGVKRPQEVMAGQTTLLQSHQTVTYLLQNGSECYVFGHAPAYYQALGCAPLPDAVIRHDRRVDCAGLDPADPAPLGGWVALTFDDGPDLSVTPRVLRTLRNNGVPATFFMVGERLSDPATWPLVEEIVADPLFDVANHSFDHADQARLAPEDALAQTRTTDQLLRTFGVVPRFYRFPYGSSLCRTADQVREQGYRVAGWHVDSADWCYAWSGRAGRGRCSAADYWRVPAEFADDMIGYVMHQVRRSEGGVILMHDIHGFTADKLGPLITHLRTEGYRFARLSDAERFPRLNRGEPFDFPRIGESCDPGADRCWETEPQARCEPVGASGVCAIGCARGCVDRDGSAPLWCAEVGDERECVAQALPVNGQCAKVPGTVPASLPGATGNGSALVCVPPRWRP